MSFGNISMGIESGSIKEKEELISVMKVSRDIFVG